MKLLFLNYMETTAPGGINRAVQEVGAEMVRRGHAVTVLQANPESLPADEIFNGLKIIRVGSYVASSLYDLNPAMYFYLRKNFARLNPDVVHVHGYHTLLSLEVLYLLQKSKRPIVFSPHYGPESHNTLLGGKLWGVYKHISKSCFQIADKVICASEFERGNVLRDFQVDPAKIDVIPHGVDVIKHKKTRTAKPGISLIYVGWFIELKGIQYILKAMSKLNTELDAHVTLTLVGKGDYQERLMELARELNVADAVFWHPPLFDDALYTKLQEADILLLLSRSENFGIVVAEALALGVPSIVAKTTALVEFLDEPGCFGIGYPPDPTELAELIINVKDADPHVGPLSERIRTWKQVADRYERLYTTLLHAIAERG
jgi:glycosyltransferase involved in cell wall biosynthesis